MFELPEGADSEKVDAKMKNGVLSVKIGKREGYQQETKKIEVMQYLKENPVCDAIFMFIRKITV